MKLTLLYFGRPRENLGIPGENAVAPDSIATLGELLGWLRSRGGAWEKELAETRVKCAINQAFAGPDAPVKDGDEIAIFSPISGG